MEQAAPHGMRVFAQINHMGIYGGAPWQRPWSASENPVPGSPMLAHAMSVDDIAEVTAAFAAAAARVKAGGLHGVEVHCAHDFLLQQFISARHNRRDDGYGGDFESRMRFYLEVMRAVRETVGDDFVVGTRVGPHNLPGGLNVAEHVEIVNRLLEEGIIDYLNVSHGSSLNSHKIIAAMHEDPGYEVPFSEQVTALTSLPTLVTGRFTTLAQADALIEAGKADLVGMTRAHIADPDLVRKTTSGRVREVRPCIGCNQGCVGGLSKGRVGCAVNGAAGQERRLAEELIQPADESRHVVVVGGGPAGMEAARVASLRGHRVSLFEAAPSLGGTLRAARLAPKHGSIGEIVDWLSEEMERLGVDVHLAARVSAADVEALQPDAVIVAVGARPTIAELPQGAAPGRAVTAPELLAGGYNPDRGQRPGLRRGGRLRSHRRRGISAAAGRGRHLRHQPGQLRAADDGHRRRGSRHGTPAGDRPLPAAHQGDARFGRNGQRRRRLQCRMAGAGGGRGNPGAGYRPGAGPGAGRRFHTP